MRMVGEDKPATDQEKWVRLFSPVVLLKKNGCLKLDYYNRELEIDLYEYTDNSIRHIVTIPSDGQVETTSTFFTCLH